jgi:pSer/pThr/pTyr-binding forkhead associated (FHA) protein
LQALKWELVDMGSLNGTFLNSQPVNHPDVGSRRWSEPAELKDGDIITLGSSSKVSVSTIFLMLSVSKLHKTSRIFDWPWAHYF